jgi:phosphomannomutase
MSPRTSTTTLRELDHRVSDGIDVRLLWDTDADRVLVAVYDGKSGEAFTIDVLGTDSALEVFHHPFAYAGRRGIDPVPATEPPLRTAVA